MTGNYLVVYYDIVMGVIVVIAIFVVMIIFGFYSSFFTKKSSYRYGSGCAWLEITWTVAPAFILAFLSFFSLTNLYAMEMGEVIDYQSKIIAHQWYWEYEYYLSKSLFNSVFFRWDYSIVSLLGSPSLEVSEEVVNSPSLLENVWNSIMSILSPFFVGSEKSPHMKMMGLMKTMDASVSSEQSLSGSRLEGGESSEQGLSGSRLEGGKSSASFSSLLGRLPSEHTPCSSDSWAPYWSSSEEDRMGPVSSGSQLFSSGISLSGPDLPFGSVSAVGWLISSDSSTSESGMVSLKWDPLGQHVSADGTGEPKKSASSPAILNVGACKRLFIDKVLESSSKKNYSLDEYFSLSDCENNLSSSSSEESMKDPNKDVLSDGLKKSSMEKNQDSQNKVSDADNNNQNSNSSPGAGVEETTSFPSDCYFSLLYGPESLWASQSSFCCSDFYSLWWESVGKKNFSIEGFLYKNINFDIKGVSVDSYLDYSFDVFEEKEAKNLSSNKLFSSSVGLTDGLFVLPVNKTTALSVSTMDVMHSWGVPALGVKMDAVPGRVNSFCVKPVMAGFLQGQCYELCGAYHSSMPINVLIMSSEEEYKNYLVRLVWEAKNIS